jgi:6-pyruvoyltetrahydropterin/6-carboxytetrahydropterin synthase
LNLRFRIKKDSIMRVTISRKAHFNSAHRLYRKDWTFEKRCDFGVITQFHGHNYELIVSVTGQIDPETGYVMDVNFCLTLLKKK